MWATIWRRGSSCWLCTLVIMLTLHIALKWVIMLTLHIALKWVIMLTLHIALKWVIMLVLRISFLGQYVTHGDSLIDWLIDVPGVHVSACVHECVCVCVSACVRAWPLPRSKVEWRGLHLLKATCDVTASRGDTWWPDTTYGGATRWPIAELLGASHGDVTGGTEWNRNLPKLRIQTA